MSRDEASFPRHLLAISDLTKAQAIQILDTAEELARISDAPIKKLPTLRGRTIVNLFYEDSTRTRISFEAAAKRLSADVINFSAKSSSVSKGESLKDTALTLQSMGADAVILRHSAAGAAHRLAEWTHGTVINAGDGMHQHPTQALLDSFTLRRHKSGFAAGASPVGGDLSGMKVAIVGDILHSRVARSNIFLLTMLGAEVTLVAPPTLLPVGVEKWPVKISYNFDQAISDCDAVMMLRLQLERMKSAFFPSAREYARLFGLNQERLEKAPKQPLILHPGPINRGLEISADSADSANSLILEQVANGVSVRMAVLYLLLGGANG